MPVGIGRTMTNVTKEQVMKALKNVIDPDIGISILEMKLIEDVKVDEQGNVNICFHLSMPFCPAVFATQIAKDIRTYASQVKGVKSVKVELKNHYMAEQINKEINK